jgi:tetratricopeptide (TPR) repeat protein
VISFPGRTEIELPDSLKNLLRESSPDSNYIARLNTLATSYLKISPATSREIAAHVIETAPKIRNARGYARGLVVMGNSYWYEGIYEFAQNYYLLGARQYRTLNDSLGLAQVYNNIGEVNKRLGELDTALEYLHRSLEMNQKDSTRAMTLYNVAELYIKMGKYDAAMDYIRQSTSLALSIKNERVMAYNQWSLGRIKAEQGLLNDALAYYAIAEDTWIKLKETRSLIQIYQDMASTYRKMGEVEETYRYLNKASALARLINVPDLRITTYLEYSKADSLAGNFSRALYYLSKHNKLKDSVYNILKAEQVARVQAIYETEMHERENQQLRTETKLKEAELESRDLLITAVSVSLLIAGVLAVILLRQRKEILRANKDLQIKNEEISFQKNAIESQAEALLILNDELQDLNKSLAGRIDERTRQISHQDKKLAEYTFTNAHKLRAPVASILGLINLFQVAAPAEQRVILNYLKTCGEQLDNTICAINQNLEDSTAETKIGNQVIDNR